MKIILLSFERERVSGCFEIPTTPPSDLIVDSLWRDLLTFYWITTALNFILYEGHMKLMKESVNDFIFHCTYNEAMKFTSNLHCLFYQLWSSRMQNVISIWITCVKTGGKPRPPKGPLNSKCEKVRICFCNLKKLKKYEFKFLQA